MAASKKRRKSPEPEEDLAAAVADIINSPITRTTLNFLRPFNTGEEQKSDTEQQAVKLTPSGVTSSPMGVVTQPLGVSETPIGVGEQPAGIETTPGGFESKPIGIQRTQRRLWQAEGLGAIFEDGRVRRIQKAQDALSLVEEKVYDLLWGTKNQKRDEFRLVHFSLQRISTEARINIKTVRLLIPRLIEKGFLQIEHEADVRRNIPTLYRVPSYAMVLTDQKQRNRFAVSKTGKGVFYVHPYSTQNAYIPEGFGLPPTGLTPTGDDLNPMGSGLQPGGLEPMGPVGSGGSKPTGASGPLSIDICLGSKNRQTTTSFLAALADRIREILGREADSSILTSMVEACHENAMQTTGELASNDEILYFTTTKARMITHSTNIRNHVAVLRKAVPECFLGKRFRRSVLRIWRGGTRQKESWRDSKEN